MYVLSSIFLIFITYCLVKWRKRRSYIKECLKNLPEEPPVFFFGNALDFIRNSDLLSLCSSYKEKHGTLIKGEFGPTKHGLFISDHDFMKEFLSQNRNLSKGETYILTQCWLGDGLLTSGEERWRVQRKMLTPAFSIKILTDFISIFNQHSDTLVHILQKNCSVSSIDIRKFLSLCSLDIICDTVLGTSIDAQRNEELDYVKSVHGICQIITSRYMCLWKHVNLFFMFCPDYWKQRKYLNVIHDYTRKVINTRRKQRREMKFQETTEIIDEFKIRRRIPLLDMLLQYAEEGNSVSDKEIEDEVHTFMFAGHDTVSTTMGFLLYELSRNPKVQERVFEEQNQIFGNSRRGVDWSDINEMKYLDMVIKETLRMYPPVPVIGRQVTKEFSYKNHVIPQETFLLFFIYGLHRDEKLFANPDVFDPSRFEDPETVMPYSSIPFSAGPRNCIGSKFAMLEMKVIISKVLRSLLFLPAEPSHSVELEAAIVLRSKTGVKVGITHRHN